MASAEQSWESSVIQLAQAGNLRAIAFWVNRYLVPQGMCAQVLSEQPGLLLIRVVCHTQPDSDRLVRFISTRLNSLNSSAFRLALIRAHLVGTSEPLWEKPIRITPTAAATTNVRVLNSTASSQSVVPIQAAASFSATRNPVNAVPTQSVPARSAPVQSILDFQFPTSAVSGASVQAVPTASTRKPTPTKQPKAQLTPSKGARKRPRTPPTAKRPIVRKKKLKRQQSLSLAYLSRSAIRQLLTLPSTLQHFTGQSKAWFTTQTLPIRALTVGGSAVAVFLLGCGFELLRQYNTHPALGRSSASPTRFSLLKSRPNSVTTALDDVPVIYSEAQNPDDPAVSLIFSNSAALGRISKSARNEARLGTHTPTGGITAYQSADLVMTSLDHPLTLPQILPSPVSGNPRTLNSDSARRFQSNLPMPEQTIAPENQRFASRSNVAEEDEASSVRSRLPEVSVQELLANGVKVVNVADPSPLQAQTSGQVQTLDVLKKSEIHSVGLGRTPEEARRPQVFEVKGQRIAYLAYSDQTLSTSLATTAAIVPPLSTQISQDIQAIRDQVDWVIVSFRWQRRLKVYPEAWQTKVSRLAIDQGADLVVGYHPQRTQGAEVYNGRVIAYSLGSSLEEYLEDYEDYEEYDEPMPDRNTVSLKVSLQEQEMRLEFLPIQLRQGQASVANGEAGEQILESFHQASSFFDQPVRSPINLDPRVRFSLPAAPDAELPTDPFLSYPEEN